MSGGCGENVFFLIYMLHNVDCASVEFFFFFPSLLICYSLFSLLPPILLVFLFFFNPFSLVLLSPVAGTWQHTKKQQQFELATDYMGFIDAIAFFPYEAGDHDG